MDHMDIKNKLKGTKTEKNLWEAFIGECEARVRYELYGNIARKEGYEQIGSIFDETSLNEREHAEIWYEYLGQLYDTVKNLKSSIKNENYESIEMYIEFSNIAREEGFLELSEKFKKVAEIEDAHSKRFSKLENNILNGEVFHKDKNVIWQCRVCGYLEYGENAPEVCPVCAHPQGFYQLQENNF
ncbi:rubrerythrin [Candidatus Arthromitus sp. SFB-rat-Yit]|uniref:rubrerythrin n=1 Tax=Candidatus Arthromitus sp. SFB-rat-Yit TaxID=1041504 RepID=UPI000227A36F|nr:rubrerythrin family protein [Candidatus Arthromitus sp. SFB-rat-Yit]BAK80868.1 rubrerythrin [Candidatus Arthromitus sp. SFB-rat-Yit]